MGIDETGTLGALRVHRAELIDPTIAEHNGRVVKLMGDGMLVEFASAIDAVECAVAIQQGMAVRNAMDVAIVRAGAAGLAAARWDLPDGARGGFMRHKPEARQGGEARLGNSRSP